jgi:hypothetical protein
MCTSSAGDKTPVVSSLMASALQCYNVFPIFFAFERSNGVHVRDHRD